jgi:hypothetical protein
MTKIKKYGIWSLVINGILTIGGGVGFLFALKAVNEFYWSGSDMSEYGEMSMLILGLVGAAMMIALFVPLAHLVLCGFNSLMMLLQVLTGKRGFSVLPILLSVILVMFNGAFVLGGIFIFIPLVALSLISIVLNIKSLEKNKETE